MYNFLTLTIKILSISMIILFLIKLIGAYLMVYTYINSKIIDYLEKNNITISNDERYNIIRELKEKYKSEHLQSFKISMFKFDLKAEDLPVIEKKYNMNNKIIFYLKNYKFPDNNKSSVENKKTKLISSQKVNYPIKTKIVRKGNGKKVLQISLFSLIIYLILVITIISFLINKLKV